MITYMGIAIRTTRDLGVAVNAARTALGMTQAELAERAQVSRRWIVALERGFTPGLDFTRVMKTLYALDLQFEAAPYDHTPPPVDLDALTEW